MNLVFDSRRQHYSFGLFDRVVIDNVAWRPVSSNEVGWVMTRPEEAGISHQFTHAGLSHLGGSGRILTEPNYFTSKAACRRVAETEMMISLLTDQQQANIFARQIWVEAFQELERKRKVKRSDESINASMGDIMREASKLGHTLRGKIASHASAGINWRTEPSPRSLRKWLKLYEADGLAGLVDRVHLRGNRNRQLCHTGLSWMMEEVRGYMHPDRPNILTIINRIKGVFSDRNDEREAQGLPAISVPSRETVRRAVRSLDPFQVELRRNGSAAARKKFAPVGKGMTLTRPLERVEIDEWDIDLLTILADTGLLEWFSDDERKALGLNKRKVRWKLTVAICATTRCILAMIMTPSAKASAAVQTIKMVLADKGSLTTAVKAHSQWHMHGLPEEIVTDCGSAFRSQEFQTVCADLGIAAQRTVAGIPELRGRIERVFRTISVNLLPELAGRTFSSIAEKGDSNPGDRACLSENDLAFVLVRWVVDIYHNTEHGGLDGETPAQCWERLSREHGVTTPPDSRTLRRIFGEKLRRKLDKSGILVLGVRYHSENLAAHFAHRRDRELEVRWLSSDIGEIEVRVDKDWMTVPAVMESVHGVGAQLWMSAVREVRASDPERKRHDESVMRTALAEIRARSEDAQAAMGLIVDEWSDERVDREEQKLMMGFMAGPAPEHPTRQGGIGRSVLIDQAGDVTADAPSKTKPAAAKRSSKFKLGE